MSSPEPERLSEAQVADAFHTFLQKALAQAKAERLLDESTLASAEADIMVSGPALCLYFAALRSTGSPPSVPLPGNTSGTPLVLSAKSCPETFTNFFALWAASVAPIQSLSSPLRHDLARIICDQPPLSPNIRSSLHRIAADLRAVAIEISQRRTFQNRYGADLQVALDSGGGMGRRSSVQAKFTPPPAYGGDGQMYQHPEKLKVQAPTHLYSTSPTLSSAASGRSGRSSRSARASPSPPHSPVILNDSDPIIDVIRETLYAALADVLSLAPSLRPLLSTDPIRAFFSSVALAVLEVSSKAVTPSGDVEGVLGQYVTFDDCPEPLRPLMRELIGISRLTKAIEEEDDALAMELISHGRDDELRGTVTRMERLKAMLERGSGVEEMEVSRGNGRASPSGTTLQLANRINALALRLTQLPTFRERQHDVFNILRGVR
ncbi:hypothetical protein BS47DRAFT_1348209 [Hydnum rufescens UP504]|uniref:Uncharacterized protein n=1 Tax=Hydnum rufescens UP504 TaxID=1448309 RepID=A0A9P6ASZ4_9AGAM|nr:hypothetical protein BS47DRAFT_1348209 [Hydnum rufescens UP504]